MPPEKGGCWYMVGFSRAGATVAAAVAMSFFLSGCQTSGGLEGVATNGLSALAGATRLGVLAHARVERVRTVRGDAELRRSRIAGSPESVFPPRPHEDRRGVGGGTVCP